MGCRRKKTVQALSMILCLLTLLGALTSFAAPVSGEPGTVGAVCLDSNARIPTAAERREEIPVYPDGAGDAKLSTAPEAAADEDEDEDDDDGFFDAVLGFFGNIIDFFKDLINDTSSLKDLVWGLLTDPFGVLVNGGLGMLNEFTGGITMDFLGEDWTAWSEYTAMARIGNKVYEIVYPFGVLVLVLAWAFGMTTAGLTLSLDPGNKYSIFRAALQLLVGMMLLSSGPYILQLIFAIFQSIRISIAGQMGTLSLHALVLAILKIKCSISFVKIILLQSISPLYMGAFSGGEGTRRLAMNCLKEYLILCFEGVYATVFLLLADAVWTKMVFSISLAPGPKNLLSIIGIIAVGAAMWGSGKAVRELIK